MEAAGQPGSARYGNFINYYSFNPAERRLGLLSDSFLHDLCFKHTDTAVTCLDVGCNAGDLTLKLYSYLKESCKQSHEIHMLGVDLDPVLIARSKDANPFQDNIVYQTADIMNADDRTNVIYAHLGHLQQKQFHLLSCFSVSMWVHLNHGDSGLQDFLEFISSVSQFVLIEPQPWKCYKTATRRMRKLKCDPFDHFELLKWRENVDQDIKSYLQNKCNMVLVKEFGQTEWDRSVCLFKSN